MNYSFTLVLAGMSDISEAEADRLFAAGCDDCTPGVSGTVVCVDFDREAPTAKAALDSAIKQVKAAGFSVRRVEPDDLVTQAEIARRLDCSREYVRLLIDGQRGPGGFPQAVAGATSTSPLWSWVEVARWAAENELLDRSAVSWAELIQETNTYLEADLARKKRGEVTVKARVVESAGNKVLVVAGEGGGKKKRK